MPSSTKCEVANEEDFDPSERKFNKTYNLFSFFPFEEAASEYCSRRAAIRRVCTRLLLRRRDGVCAAAVCSKPHTREVLPVDSLRSNGRVYLLRFMAPLRASHLSCQKATRRPATWPSQSHSSTVVNFTTRDQRTRSQNTGILCPSFGDMVGPVQPCRENFFYGRGPKMSKRSFIDLSIVSSLHQVLPHLAK